MRNIFYCKKCLRLLREFAVRDFDDTHELFATIKHGTVFFLCENKECERDGFIVRDGYTEEERVDVATKRNEANQTK